jgi:hypothetical protein
MIKDVLNGIVLRRELGEHVAESIRVHSSNGKASRFGVIEVYIDFNMFLLNIANIIFSDKMGALLRLREGGGGNQSFSSSIPYTSCSLTNGLLSDLATRVGNILNKIILEMMTTDIWKFTHRRRGEGGGNQPFSSSIPSASFFFNIYSSASFLINENIQGDDDGSAISTHQDN